MKKKKKELLLFIAIFIITILLLRFWVLIIQEKSIYILGYEIHHMFIGIFLVLLSGFSRFFSKNKVLNKIDLLNKKEIKEIMKNFSKDKDSEVVTLSTLDKQSISKIKAKLLSYVS